MYSKTLLATLFLLSMSHLVAEENLQVRQLMSDMEQIKQQISALQSTGGKQDLTDQILQLAAQIQYFHSEAIRHSDREISLLQTNFTKQIEELKKEIATSQQWESKAFEILTKTLEEIQNKFLMKERSVANAADTPIIDPTIAQEEKPEKEEMTPSTVEECTTPYHNMNVGVRHNEARGVGYKQGYSTLEGFFTFDDWFEDWLPFLDLRGHVFNDARLAGNAGVGMRTLLSSINHYLGTYLYYDIRNVRHLTVNQLGPGVELLSKCMEYRVNGYFPVGKLKSHFSRAEFYEFEGNSLIIKRKRKRALFGVDGEVGAHFLQSDSDWDLYAGATPYYLWNSQTSAFGGKLRLKGSYMQYVSLEILGTYDHLFRATVQGSVAFRYPFGPQPKRKGTSCFPEQNDDLLVARVTQSPYRFEIPMIKNQRRKEAAVDPASGEPYTFWFVNNTSSSAGTFESPFPTLVQAQDASGPTDVIYVFPGDGTTNGMNQGITLQTNQKLFGSGMEQRLATTHGTVTIPAFSSGSPLITNSAGDVVILANNNEVSGMNILATFSGSNGMNGLSHIIGTDIHNNTFSGNVDYNGINIIGYETLIASNNTLTNVVSAVGMGIAVVPLDAQVSDITISNNAISGFNSSIHTTPSANPTTATGNILISGNNLSNFTSLGIAWTTGMAGSMVQIVDNFIVNNVASGGFNNGIFVDLNNPGDAGTVYINYNTILSTTPNLSKAIVAKFDLARNTSASYVISNNNMLVGTSAGSDGILLTNNAGQALCLSIFDNVIQANPGFNSILMTPGGTINIQNFSGNIAPNISIAPVAGGSVNLVESCNP